MPPRSLGDLEQLVLLAIIHLGDDAFSLSIRTLLHTRSHRLVSLGTIYSTLARLEEKGYVRSSLSKPLPVRGGRGRRSWVLTAPGRRAVNDAMSALMGLLDGLVIAPARGRS